MMNGLRNSVSPSGEHSVKRMLTDVLTPLDEVVETSANLAANRDVRFQFDGELFAFAPNL